MERPYLNGLGRLSGKRVLDLGCGTGRPIAQYFLSHGGRVTGVDGAAAMTRLCKRRFPTAAWITHDMRSLDLGRRFDIILAWDSFFFLTPGDQRAMFPVFADHAKPGARLLFTSGPEAGKRIGTFEGEPLYHASLDPVEYRALLRRYGFAVQRFRPEDPNCGGHTVWLARKRG